MVAEVAMKYYHTPTRMAEILSIYPSVNLEIPTIRMWNI